MAETRCTQRQRRREPLEALVAGRVGGVFDVEPCQTKDGTGEVECRDDGDGLGDDGMIVPFLAQTQKQKRRGGTKADGIAQAIELPAELAGRARQRAT